MCHPPPPPPPPPTCIYITWLITPPYMSRKSHAQSRDGGCAKLVEILPTFLQGQPQAVTKDVKSSFSLGGEGGGGWVKSLEPMHISRGIGQQVYQYELIHKDKLQWMTFFWLSSFLESSSFLGSFRAAQHGGGMGVLYPLKGSSAPPSKPVLSCHRTNFESKIFWRAQLFLLLLCFLRKKPRLKDFRDQNAPL